MELLNEQILANGLKVRFVKNTKNTHSACLIVPYGENHEGPHRPQTAHACEHLCVAFNGGFKNPYDIIKFNEKYGIKLGATTHAEYTCFSLRDIPVEKNPIQDSVKFFQGIFHITNFRNEKGKHELQIIKNEIQNQSPNQALMWAMAYWIRQGDGTPTEKAILHRGIPELNIENTLSFHKEYYRPSLCSLVISLPETSSIHSLWSSFLLTHMSTKPIGGEYIPVVRNRYLPGSESFVSISKLPTGIWNIPVTTKNHWFLTGIPFWCNKHPTLANIRARCFVTSCCRMSGSTNVSTMTPLDYIRRDLGIAYKLNGTVLPIKHRNGRRGYMAILGTITSRPLDLKETYGLLAHLKKHIDSLPGRGSLRNLSAWFLRNRFPDVIRECLTMCNISFINKLEWKDIKHAYDPSIVKYSDACFVYSSKSG
jgi:hypothetical protein